MGWVCGTYRGEDKCIQFFFVSDLISPYVAVI